MQKSCCLKINFLCFLANLIFVVSHLKIHPAVHLNTSKCSAIIAVKDKSLLQFTWAFSAVFRDTKVC